MRDVASLLIWLGSLIVVVGLVLRYAPWLVSWFGRLPGDVRIERDGATIFIPFTSMILVSIVLSILLNLLDR